jgi:hypothetical protein
MHEGERTSLCGHAFIKAAVCMYALTRRIASMYVCIDEAYSISVGGWWFNARVGVSVY